MNTVFSPLLPGYVSSAQLDISQLSEHPLRPEELEGLGDRASASRRQGFQLGRGAASLALKGLGVDAPPITRGETGEPNWPPDIVGSITHTGDHALAAVAHQSNCGGIGIDLERLVHFPDLMNQTAFDDELDNLNSLPTPERDRQSFEIFSAKESIYKAFFPRVGRYFGFEAVRLAQVPGKGFRLGRFVKPIDAAYPIDRTFRVDTEWYDDLVLATVVLPPED